MKKHRSSNWREIEDGSPQEEISQLRNQNSLIRISNTLEITNRLLGENSEIKVESHHWEWWENLDNVWKWILCFSIQNKATYVIERWTYISVIPTDTTPVTPSRIELQRILHLQNLRLGGIKQLSLGPIKELKKLTNVQIKNCNIKSLDCFSELTNMTILDVSGNMITNLAPLSNLRSLTELKIDSNGIDNLEPLRTLEKLAKLNISNNKIENLEPPRWAVLLVRNNLSMVQDHKIRTSIVASEFDRVEYRK